MRIVLRWKDGRTDGVSAPIERGRPDFYLPRRSYAIGPEKMLFLPDIPLPSFCDVHFRLSEGTAWLYEEV